MRSLVLRAPGHHRNIAEMLWHCAWCQVRVVLPVPVSEGMMCIRNFETTYQSIKYSAVGFRLQRQGYGVSNCFHAQFCQVSGC